MRVRVRVSVKLSVRAGDQQHVVLATRFNVFPLEQGSVGVGVGFGVWVRVRVKLLVVVVAGNNV